MSSTQEHLPYWYLQFFTKHVNVVELNNSLTAHCITVSTSQRSLLT